MATPFPKTIKEKERKKGKKKRGRKNMPVTLRCSPTKALWAEKFGR